MTKHHPYNMKELRLETDVDRLYRELTKDEIKFHVTMKRDTKAEFEAARNLYASGVYNFKVIERDPIFGYQIIDNIVILCFLALIFTGLVGAFGYIFK